ncbi:hypothetical protein OSB04_009174 [Centaurea solstitialis]|uniref:Uncharacterized protein n=1 Tax=Centaurea solstitialis TaxID=347529 RepID=A0AA38TNC0_9ASTR|nr:hypothetical protein OSB04_009174 [Centaurea solstitialis]
MANEIFTTNHSPEKSTNPVGDFFTEAAGTWLNAAMPYLIVAAVLFICFNVLSSCIGWCLSIGGREMRAPGRPTMRIQRGGFESNPRGYFRDLRGR